MAAENLGVLASGATIATVDQTLLLRRLNVIAKQYQGTSDGAPGMKIHTRQRVTLMLAKGQQTYLVGPASTDARASTQVGRTTLSAAEASGQTVLSITSNTDTTSYPGTTVTMTSGDFIGIQQDDGTIHWSTISGTPSTTATIAAATTVNAASGNYVWWFTSRAQRFPTVESAVLRNSSFNDMPLDIYTDVRQYEMGVVDKFADGSPTSILVEPLRIATRVTLDTQPTDVTETIVLTVLYPAEDYDATTDDIAFPQEAFRFLAWELAWESHAAFGVDWTAGMDKLRGEARAMYLNMNPENSVLYFRSAE